MIAYNITECLRTAASRTRMIRPSVSETIAAKKRGRLPTPNCLREPRRAARLARYEEQARIVIIVPTSVEFPSRCWVVCWPARSRCRWRCRITTASGDMLAMLDDCQPSCIVTSSAMAGALKARLNGYAMAVARNAGSGRFSAG